MDSSFPGFPERCFHKYAAITQNAPAGTGNNGNVKNTARSEGLELRFQVVRLIWFYQLSQADGKRFAVPPEIMEYLGMAGRSLYPINLPTFLTRIWIKCHEYKQEFIRWTQRATTDCLSVEVSGVMAKENQVKSRPEVGACRWFPVQLIPMEFTPHFPTPNFHLSHI